MDCLNCTQPLVALEIEHFEIDYCLKCGGIWLDHGELELLLGDAMPDNLLKNDTSVSSLRSKGKCPVCGKRMEAIMLGTGDRVELDICSNGHGLWFDRGELKTVVEFLQKPVREAVVKQLESIFSLTGDA
ncbi:MAG: zf-TFIIB domain-containing protein [Candidatus Zixiibacteriota bacterium]